MQTPRGWGTRCPDAPPSPGRGSSAAGSDAGCDAGSGASSGIPYGGRPCIRGVRVRVIDVLELLVAGETSAQILADYPYLEADDIAACLLYAARRLNHPNVAAWPQVTALVGAPVVWVDAQLPPALARWLQHTHAVDAWHVAEVEQLAAVKCGTRRYGRAWWRRGRLVYHELSLGQPSA